MDSNETLATWILTDLTAFTQLLCVLKGDLGRTVKYPPFLGTQKGRKMGLRPPVRFDGRVHHLICEQRRGGS